MRLNPFRGEILYIDKPLGWTSFGVVNRVRGILRTCTGVRNLRVGHAGTLDPLATGVLIVCTGRKTKQIDTLQAGIKEYVAQIEIGATTPSFDLETEVDQRYPWQHITTEQVAQVLQEQFTGSIEQVPPAFSACKVDGKPAYKLARKGKEVNIRAKTLVIDEIELLESHLPEKPSITIRVVCSKGTYIRALARDIGQALGSGAHLTALRRTRIGKVSIGDCMSVEQISTYLERAEYVSVQEDEAERIEQERQANRQREAERKKRDIKTT